jgi:hypothetical protein
MIRCLRSLSTYVLSATLLCGASAMAQDAAPAARIVSPINERQLVPLKGTVHPLANARNDRGAAPDEMKLERVHLLLTRSAAQESALRQTIAEMHTPGTASYHKWLTPAQFGAQFGPSGQDIATVENWLTSQGFSVTGVSAGKQTIEFSGNVAQFRQAFHTQIHQYMVDGQMRTANVSDPQIPAALAPVVGGFASLNNFPAKSNSVVMGKAAYDPKTDQATPQWTTGSAGTMPSFALSPQDYAVQYDLNPLYASGTNGSGQTIAIVNESNVDVGVVNSFRALFGLPVNPPQVIIDGYDPGVNGINNPNGPNGAAVEAYLDVEWAGAVAPDATIDLVIAGDTALESGLNLAAEHAVYSDVAPVLSVSFGGCEANNRSAIKLIGPLWEEAAAQGQTVLVSAGDGGSAGCDNFDFSPYASYGLGVNALGSTPWNVSVGGTDFYYSQYNGTSAVLNTQLGTYWNLTPSNTTPAVSIKGVIPEQPWNSSQYGLDIDNAYLLYGSTNIQAGSGGASVVWQKPVWQSGAGVPADGARDLPDLSLFAANGSNLSFYPVCAADGYCQPVASGGTVQVTATGGTSAATPAFAGMMALVNQLYGPQGQADFVLYPMAAQFPAAFHDVTVGANTVPCDLTDATPNCIAVSNPNTGMGITEGEIGTGTTADYNAGPGYDMASGLGTIDANQMVSNWAKVKFAATTTTLTASQTSFAHGTPITLSGTVTTASGTPSGDVALLSDSTDTNSQGNMFFNLNGGAYSGTNNYLPGGSYNIWAQYGGDSVNGMSASAKVPITVTPEASTTRVRIVNMLGLALRPGTTNLPYGTQLIADAQSMPTVYYNQCILPPTPPSSCANGYENPTGGVTFTDNGTAIGTAVTNAEGDAEYNAAFGVGSHSLAAKYAGDNSYGASSSAAMTFSVVRDVPLMSITAHSTPGGSSLVQGGEPIVFQILVDNSANFGAYASNGNPLVTPAASPTGTVTFTGFPGGPYTGTLSTNTDTNYMQPEGAAIVTVPAGTPPGNYTVAASYSGDGNYEPRTENGSILVLPAAGLISTTTAALTGTISTTSSVITVSGTVTGQPGQPAPTGKVEIFVNSYFGGIFSIGSSGGDVSTYSAQLSGNIFAPGSNLIVVQYIGDSVYNESAATVNPIQGAGADFTLQTSAQTVPVTAGSSVSVTINLTPVMQFADSVNLSCAAVPGVTCSITPSVRLAPGAGSSATLTITAEADTANLSYSVPITATNSTGAYVHTLAVQGVVSGSPAGTRSFFLSSNIPSLNMIAGIGANSSTTITVWPLGGYSGTVNLVCAVKASGSAVAPACSLSRPSLSIGGTTPQTTTLSVITTQYAVARNQPRQLFWPAAGGSALALALFFTVPRRRRNWLAMMVLLALTVSFAGLGCSNNSTLAPPATSAGTYTVTVTGTSGSLTLTSAVQVNVR